MEMKRSWFGLLKKLFVSEPKSKQEKKEKRRRWILGRFKIKRLLTFTESSSFKEKILSEADEEQRRHAVAVAIATAAAAEAAVAAAQAAAEVVRLTHAPQSRRHVEKGIRELSAIKIQTAFRGFLARKALRALKGLVRLQAMVRGRAVRRQTIKTLKSLQTLVNIQSQFRAIRLGTVEEGWTGKEKQQFLAQSYELRNEDKRLKPDSKRWDGCLLSKEEIKATLLSQKEPMIKREHMKKYLERGQTESEQCVGAQQGQDNFKSVDCSNALNVYEEEGLKLKMRDTQTLKQVGGLDSLILLPSRSIHQQKHSSIGDNGSCLSFSAAPGYMATTEAARAKARSSSAPKQRLESRDFYSDQSSTSNNRLSFCYSVGNDSTCFNRIGKPSGFQQRSPWMKSPSGPVKSYLTSKDLSLDSEFSFLNWNQQSAFR